MILPDPSADVFKECEEHTPTRVLAAAIFCILAKHLFDETTPRAEVATSFCITAAQLNGPITCNCPFYKYTINHHITM